MTKLPFYENSTTARKRLHSFSVRDFSAQLKLIIPSYLNIC